jgi:sirohydrochlorin ferrochelatase
MPAGPLTLLVDNGSLEPAATLALRKLAARLCARLGQKVEPVSLLHSSAIDPKLLAGTPAKLLVPAMERRLAANRPEFTIIPLFFGPSRALTEYIPEQVARLREKFPQLKVALAPQLFATGDDRLAKILADHVTAQLGPEPARVALVDHGSPVAAVAAVRDELARQLAEKLGARAVDVAPCSMERRPEPEYDFCKPLLADLLASPPWNTGRVIVALQFLSAGRHAGPDGDVAKICRAAEAAHATLKTQPTALVGAHPLLVEILADRWRAAVPVT